MSYVFSLLSSITFCLFRSVFFLECGKMYLYKPFFKEPQRKYSNFTIKKNMRGERAKDETFQNGFSRTLVIIWSLVI